MTPRICGGGGEIGFPLGIRKWEASRRNNRNKKVTRRATRLRRQIKKGKEVERKREVCSAKTCAMWGRRRNG